MILMVAIAVCAQSRYFKNWPAGASPREVGTRVAQNYLARQFEYQQGKRQYVIYPEVCAGYGSLTVAELTKNKALKNQLLEKFETLWSNGYVYFFHDHWRKEWLARREGIRTSSKKGVVGTRKPTGSGRKR